MLPSLIILDDFLPDPTGFREAALALEYDPAFKKGKYPGLPSRSPLAIGNLDAAISARLGVHVEGMPGTLHEHCRLTLARETGKTGVHIDPCFYSGILFLSLNRDCQGGTDFFRHKLTGLEGVPRTDDALLQAGFRSADECVRRVVNADTNFPDRWERVMRVPMRFNRLILFSPWLFHNAAPGFGDRPENARLVHLMFFAAARRPESQPSKA
ncbi:DUF6445 family protein [Stakelama pacifica]|uniref:2-oxoglutarate-Fe(II)-dependent oxygenase superfamily protein n=1 Tax=Stakelama pacifica TaxID=517720 RepID=A0A4R6FX61_9SPHN|nr:DUF6445 family protein [Stakelama pacifica]TDN85585.1 hypothetical protein EV664_102292 [Stakelama pacifica]GGO92214.1 hypothetical protein GCM10011329_08760 [Stakelama pacifica]